uniref:OmpA family protein n=1 Tax=Roseihalotalea indica TaxID=2867963 RepID=A0AA49GL87_9BACT|nr:OmpA family protein [Tunicatimonas sp. TK19036]
MTVVHLFQKLVIATMIGLILSAQPGFGRKLDNPNITDFPDYLSPGRYLIIGVFSLERNAKNFTKHVAGQGKNASYAFYPHNQYYYVYTYYSTSADSVVDACLELRKNSEFEDAWVLNASTEKNEDNPATADVDDSWSTYAPTNDVYETNEPSVVEAPTPIITENKDITERSQLYIKFQTHNASTQAQVTATIDVMDNAQSRKLVQTPTGQTEEIDKTTVLDTSLQITPYAIGYRKVQFELPLTTKAKDSTLHLMTWVGDTLIMNMPLPRLKKGDLQVMFDTYFHGNSSVMRARSRYELDELVKMLEENPTMRIKLHGHTNGAGRGFIYVYSPEAKNFFDIRRSKEYKKNGVGSTKLSALRAETIKSYLVNNGIAEDRVETEGWGGKRMLYDADSPLAKHNIRVEIEVLSE